jgi:hypothetical protein
MELIMKFREFLSVFNMNEIVWDEVLIFNGSENSDEVEENLIVRCPMYLLNFAFTGNREHVSFETLERNYPNYLDIIVTLRNLFDKNLKTMYYGNIDYEETGTIIFLKDF